MYQMKIPPARSEITQTKDIQKERSRSKNGLRTWHFLESNTDKLYAAEGSISNLLHMTVHLSMKFERRQNTNQANTLTLQEGPKKFDNHDNSHLTRLLRRREWRIWLLLLALTFLLLDILPAVYKVNAKHINRT